MSNGIKINVDNVCKNFGDNVIALDNVSKKVSGGYEWLHCLDYIKCVTERELTMDLVMEMLCKENCRFENDCLQPYYELIRNQIRYENL